MDNERVDDGSRRTDLFVKAVVVERRLFEKLRGQDRKQGLAWTRLRMLRRLAGDMEHVLGHEKSIEALEALDAILGRSREEQALPPDQVMLDRILKLADEGLDGTIGRWREMSVWTAVEPSASMALCRAWSEAISAASLVRTLACAVNTHVRYGRLRGWLVMQGYGTWRSCMLLGSADPCRNLATVVDEVKRILEELDAEEKEAGDEA